MRGERFLSDIEGGNASGQWNPLGVGEPVAIEESVHGRAGGKLFDRSAEVFVSTAFPGQGAGEER